MDNLEQAPVTPEHLHNTQTPEFKDGLFSANPEANTPQNTEVPKEAGDVAVDIAVTGPDTGNEDPAERGSLELPDHEAKAAFLEHLLNEGELSLADSTGAQKIMEQVNGIMEERK